jgi:hypothetical protein
MRMASNGPTNCGRIASRASRLPTLHDGVGHATSLLDITEIHDVNDVRCFRWPRAAASIQSIAESFTITGHELDCDLPMELTYRPR